MINVTVTLMLLLVCGRTPYALWRLKQARGKGPPGTPFGRLVACLHNNNERSWFLHGTGLSNCCYNLSESRGRPVTTCCGEPCWAWQRKYTLVTWHTIARCPSGCCCMHGVAEALAFFTKGAVQVVPTNLQQSNLNDIARRRFPQLLSFVQIVTCFPMQQPQRHAPATHSLTVCKAG